MWVLTRTNAGLFRPAGLCQRRVKAKRGHGRVYPAQSASSLMAGGANARPQPRCNAW
jgi:hypothetical protein